MRSSVLLPSSFLNRNHPAFDEVPFYFSRQPSLVTSVSDHTLALAAPLLSYWIASLTFHFFDTCNWKCVEKYRIHESFDVQSRNRASRSDVVWAVLFQQVVQTALGAYWLSGGAESTETDRLDSMNYIAQELGSVLSWTVGDRLAGSLLDPQGPNAVYFLYWWGIPVAQFLFALCVSLSCFRTQTLTPI
jgi:sphinganine C4-monooxygenase